MLIALLNGRPYVGKGTQAELLVREHDFVAFSSGKKYREIIACGGEKAQTIERYNKLGLLVPDEIHIPIFVSVWEDFIQKNFGRNIILDAAIRTPGQAGLIGFIRSPQVVRHYKITQLVFDASEEEVLRRLHEDLAKGEKSERGRQKRDDDDPEVFKTRLREYREKTIPCIHAVEAMGVRTERIRIIGEQPVEITSEQTRHRLGLSRLVAA